jgi:hypothetical protein
LHHYGSLLLIHLPSIPYIHLLIYVLFAAYLWLAYKTKRRNLLLATYFATCIALVFAFSAEVLSLVGYGLLIYVAKQRALRIALVIMVSYYALIAYNPVFWHFAAGKVPIWMVPRIQELNSFAMAATVVGVGFIVQYPLLRWGRKRLSYMMLGVVIGLFLFYFVRPIVNDYSLADIWDSRSITLNAERRQRFDALRTLAPALQGQTVYSNDPNLAVNVPGVVVANVLSYNPENESPMTNILQRQLCSQQLADYARLSDLQAAGVTRIITDPPYNLKLAKKAKTRPYLPLIAESQGYHYQVYAVKPGHTVLRAGVCAIPFGQ